MRIKSFFYRTFHHVSYFPFISVFVFLTLMVSVNLSAQEINVTSAGSILAPENELLLELRLDGVPLDFTVIAYQFNGQTFVALSEVAEGIGFPIKVDSSKGLAGGWFISEERGFDLDLESNVVVSDGQSFKLDDAVVRGDQDLYVSVSALQEWFPVNFDPDIRSLSLSIDPRERLPFQDRLDRLNRRPQSFSGFGRKPELPLKKGSYEVFGHRFVDVRLNTSSFLESPRDSSPDLAGSYSVLSQGDLFWMTSTIAVSGSDNDDVSGGRFKLERGSLDGPLALDYVEVGDTALGSRGILLRGGGAEEGLGNLFADETVDLRGDIPSDWEVELYRNGVFLDSQVVGPGAQYEFINAPLVIGENVFELFFYGPFGEQRRDERVFFVGRNRLDIGDVSYQLAAVQSGRSVFDISNQGGKGDIDSGRYVMNVNFGLLSNVTARTSLDSFEEESGRFENYSASLSGNFGPAQANVGYSWNALGQDQASGLLRTRLSGTTTAQFSYSEYFDDVEDESDRSDLLQWRANASLNSKIQSTPYNISVSHEERARSELSTADVGTSLRFFGRNRFSTFFSYSREVDELAFSSPQESLRGGSRLSFSAYPWFVRVGSAYGILPEAEVNTAFSSADLSISSNMSLNIDVEHSPVSDYTSYQIGLNWRWDYLQISPQVVYDSNDAWLGLLTLSASLYTVPGGDYPRISTVSQSNFGSVRSRVFLDNDGNQVWSPGDRPVSGVKVLAPQSFKRASTDENGTAYMTRLISGRRTDVFIDQSTVDDIELKSTFEGASIEPRAGGWNFVDFPMVKTMEIEGTVYSVSSRNGDPAGLPRVVVELIDAEGEVVSRQQTAFDGFFLFANVLPGSYQLRLASIPIKRISESPSQIVVKAAGGVRRGLDFVVQSWRDENIQNLATGLPDNSNDEPRPSFAPAEASTPAAMTSAEATPLDPEPMIVEEPLPGPAQVIEEPVEVSSRPAGNWFVQLGAFSIRENATRRWEQLQKAGVFPDDQEPRYQDAGNLVRLLTGRGLPEERARALCARIKSDGLGGCLVRELAE